MNQEQLSSMVLEHTKEIESLKGSLKTAFNRLNDIDKVAGGIHELSNNVGAMTLEIKHFTTRMDKELQEIKDKHLQEIKDGQKNQGERIGNIEKNKLEIEKKILERGVRRWDGIIGSVVTALIIASLLYFLGLENAGL